MWLAHFCTIHLISEKKIQFFLRPRRLQSLEMPLLVGIICECKLFFQGNILVLWLIKCLSEALPHKTSQAGQPREARGLIAKKYK